MSLFEQLVIDGKQLDVRIGSRVLAARHVRTMEGAASIEIVMSDPDYELLRSEVLNGPTNRKRQREKLTQAAWSQFGRPRLGRRFPGAPARNRNVSAVDGAFFRLAGVSGQYDADAQQLTITFEDEVWSQLRRHKGPMKATRPESDGGAGVTRAQFIARMIREVHPRPTYVIPELSEDQPIKGNLPEQRRKRREKGFAPGSGLTAKGAKLDEGQKRVAERVLTVADDEKAGERATLALLVACIQEPDRPFNNPNFGHSSSVGILQLLDLHLGGSTSTNGGRRDIELVCRAFLTGEIPGKSGKGGFTGNGGAIDVAAENPSFAAARIAGEVQGNAVGERDYAPWEDEAADILAAWGGSGRVRITSSKYEYRRLGGRRGEQDETSSECIRRLADEVRWRAWADENVFHLVTDPWLFQNRPVTTIRPDKRGLAGVSFDADVGIPVAEIRLKARTERWDGAPGDCVELDEFGPLDGRWLTWELEHDLLTGDTDITLRRPRPALPEPAPDREKTTLTEPARTERGSQQQRVIEAAEKALKRKDEFIYSMGGSDSMTSLWTRNPPNRTTIGLRFDCSKFVSLCFKHAGAPDPNGSGSYNGFTGTLMANGEDTNDPTPGDTLVFFGANPAAAGGNSHVGLYIGNGMMIDNHGPTGGHGIEKRAVKSAGTPHSYRKYPVD